MKYCCQKLKEKVEYICDKHPDPFDCPDNLIYYSNSLNVYGLIVHDGGSSFIQIDFCPFCGTKLNIEQD